ncbi:MAG: T9SS type A sorting domain-containing protein [Bacteroidales bacterium]|nr:T9SS type A sorting domain-containing protein [Bacteroidales bacterium]
MQRYRNYYYSTWIDECPYFEDRIVDSIRYEKYEFVHEGYLLCQTEITSQPLKVRGLAVMTDMIPHGPCLNYDHVPEYMYICQRIDTFNTINHPGIYPRFQVKTLDSVRWDTASPRIMSISNAPFDSVIQRCYVREAYFDKPVYVDSLFMIRSSFNNLEHAPEYDNNVYIHQPFFLNSLTAYKYRIPKTTQSAQMEPKIVLYYNQCRRDDPPFLKDLKLEFLDVDGPYFGLTDTVTWGEHWYTFHTWYDDFGPFFPIVYHYIIEGISADESMGTVLGGGRVPEEQTTLLTAHALSGYRFTHWNDGNTNNPRSVVSERDTQFIAYFVEMGDVEVMAEANNAAWGSVEGGGTYPYGSMVTLEAQPADSCFFEMWADGVLEPSRTVTVTSDTLFTALFAFDSSLLGVTHADYMPTLTVTPNPAHTQIRVASDEAMSLVTLRDMNGRTVLEARPNATATVLNVSQMPSGTYILTATTPRGTASRKLVVQ